MDPIEQKTDQDKITIEQEVLAEQQTVEEAPIGPTLLLDSSFILAFLNLDDPNHRGVQSVFGLVTPYNCKFHIPIYVLHEVLSKIIHSEKKVSIAIRRLDEFLGLIRDGLFIGTNPNLDELVDRYKKLAKRQAIFLQSNDFIIVTEGLLSDAMILTCDSSMYKKVKDNYKNIYYVATDAKDYQDGITIFTKQFMKIAIKKTNGT